MRYCFDNCISPYIAHSIRELCCADRTEVCHLRDLGDRDALDVVWIKQLGEAGDWAVISGDARILKNPHERQAWRDARLTGFFWARGRMRLKLWDQAWRIVRWWPEIQKQAELVQPGATFEIPVKHATRFRQL